MQYPVLFKRLSLVIMMGFFFVLGANSASTEKCVDELKAYAVAIAAVVNTHTPAIRFLLQSYINAYVDILTRLVEHLEDGTYNELLKKEMMHDFQKKGVQIKKAFQERADYTDTLNNELNLLGKQLKYLNLPQILLCYNLGIDDSICVVGRIQKCKVVILVMTEIAEKIKEACLVPLPRVENKKIEKFRRYCTAVIAILNTHSRDYRNFFKTQFCPIIFRFAHAVNSADDIVTVGCLAEEFKKDINQVSNSIDHSYRKEGCEFAKQIDVLTLPIGKLDLAFEKAVAKNICSECKTFASIIAEEFSKIR